MDIKLKAGKKDFKRPLFRNFRLRKATFFAFAVLIESILLINLLFLIQK